MILASDETPDVDDTVLRTQKTDVSIHDSVVNLKKDAKVDAENAMDDNEKIGVRKLLERYGSKDRNLEDREFRILQGVIRSNFGLSEHIMKQ